MKRKEKIEPVLSKSPTIPTPQLKDAGVLPPAARTTILLLTTDIHDPAGRQTEVKLALTAKIDMPRAGADRSGDPIQDGGGGPFVCVRRTPPTGPAEVFRFFFVCYTKQTTGLSYSHQISGSWCLLQRS